MAKFLLAGGYDEESDEFSQELMQEFVKCLAREIISQNHILIGGAQTVLDADSASAANEMCISKTNSGDLNFSPEHRIRSFVDPSVTPSHDFGFIGHSEQKDWSLIGRRFFIPEPIDEADAIIFVGGYDGTYRAANWGRLASKPLIPVASFGMASRDIFKDEIEMFHERYAERLDKQIYATLNRVKSTIVDERLEKFAASVVNIAERLVTPTDVFIIMSYSDREDLVDRPDDFASVCNEFGFTAKRGDQNMPADRIVEHIYTSIRKSAFVIVDVTEPKPNVYYELGFARGLGIPVILTAKEGTVLPFDIFDLPVHFWSNSKGLKRKLRSYIGKLAKDFGRV